MSHAIVYGALLAFPAVMLLIPEPVDLLWVTKHSTLAMGVPPMPAELREQSRRNAYYLMFAKYGLLCTFLYVLIRRYSVPAPSIGLSLHRWGVFGAIGAVAGVGLLAYWAVVTRIPLVSTGVALTRHLERWTHRSNAQQSFLIVVNSFAEEFWRAFCLVALGGLGHRALFAVLATSFAFGLAHHEAAGAPALKLGRICGHSTSGAYLAIFFLLYHSIIVTWIAHLLFNSVRLRQARMTRPG